ncbi:uncharacterized protein LOC112041352 [Lingula anatina]|uniref:Uncharacterized protein LOC112041352 n=1 Tax=Lingula anatina TaxID=7574 RepID=A0A2R2MJD3_LINAN|nr:uncharacterized protein LOC112041352 [Lingula anatina]|eukprot:XP_023930187.1 uncharacterized protein LOC112041352 [Lingula anatina]
MLGPMEGIALNSNVSKNGSSWGQLLWHILHDKPELVLRKGAMLYSSGEVAAASYGFGITSQELKAIKEAMDSSSHRETIHIQGVTYCVKVNTPNTLLAWNGGKYLIVCRSKQLYLVTHCASRSKKDDARKWLTRFASKLVEQNY